MKKSILAALSACCLCCPAIAPFSAIAAEAPTVKDIIERFDKAQASAESLRAPITLTIKRSMLQSPSVSKGTLYISGSEFAHLAFAHPDDLVMHITNRSLVSYSASEKKCEVVKIRLAKKVDRKALALGQKLPFISDYFKLESSAPADRPGDFMLTLRPRSISLRKKIELIRIWVDSKTSLPKSVLWIERGGDSWQLDIGTIQAGAQIPASARNFALPAGAAPSKGFSFFRVGE